MNKAALLTVAVFVVCLYFGVAEGKLASFAILRGNDTFWKLPPAFTSGNTTMVAKDGSIYSGRLTMIFQNQTERDGGYGFEDLAGNYYIGNATLDRYYKVNASGPGSYQCGFNMTFAFLHPMMLCGSDNPNATVIDHGYQYLAVSFRPVRNPPRAWGVLYSCVDNTGNNNFYFGNPHTGYPYFLTAHRGFVNGERFTKISFENVDLLDNNANYPNFNAPCEGSF